MSAQILEQEISIPADAPSAFLVWADAIHNHKPDYVPGVQEFRVEIRDTHGAVLKTVFVTGPGAPLETPWTLRRVDVSDLIGQTVRIVFVVEASSGFLTVHLDAVSVAVGEGIVGNGSYDVYFGMNPGLGPGDYLGNTTQVNWTLPRLAYDGTYYWQVAAPAAGLSATGPVWRFTTASQSVDHFVWGPMPSLCHAGEPFPVSVIAQDAAGWGVPGFSGSVDLAGWVREPTNELFRFDFEDGLSGWTIDNASGQGGGLWHLSEGRRLGAGHSISNSLYYGVNEGPSGGGNYDAGASQGIAVSPVLDLVSTVTPVRLEFRYVVQTEAMTNYDCADVLVWEEGQTQTNLVAGNKRGGVRFEDPVERWQSVCVDLTSFVNRSVRVAFRFMTMDSYENAYEGWYVDDVRITAGGRSAPVPVAPVGGGAFVSGVWNGTLMVLDPHSNLWLSADDRLGHGGDSDRFEVKVPEVAPSGTPLWWLVRHGLTNESAELEEQRDTDFDGRLAWEEYVSDTDPTVGASVFEITRFLLRTNVIQMSWQGGQWSKQYVDAGWIEGATNTRPVWVAVFTNTVLPTTITNLILPGTGTESGTPTFYRLRAER
jgi:hypothetical protein